MRTILTFVAAFGIFSSLQAQSLELIGLPSGQVAVGNCFDDVSIPVGVRNNGTADIEVRIERTVDNLQPSHTSSFCWGSHCYLPSVSLSQHTLVIPVGATENTFKLDVAPNGVCGVDVVEIKYYDESNPNDAISHTFEIIFGTASQESPLNSKLSAAYPVPASSFVYVDAAFPADNQITEAYLMDVTGKEIRTNYTLNGQTLALEVQNLASGVYVLNMNTQKGDKLTRKVVVE